MNIEMLARFLEKFEPDGEVFFSHDNKTFKIDDVFDCVHRFSFGLEEDGSLLPHDFEEKNDFPIVYIFKLKEDDTAPIAAK